MRIEKTKAFRKEYDRLPVEIRELYKKKEVISKQGWLDSRLQIKRIKELPGVYSFRIRRCYRVLFYFRKTDTVFFKVGHRKKVYKNL